jgi:sugar/nucleoside kinase (ribokinase family)
MLHSRQETGRAVALVSPDSERTFATFLGAAVELSAQHLDNNTWFQPPASSIQYPVSSIQYPASIFHLEGYLVFNEELILKAVQQAKQAGMQVSIDMASYNVVAAKLDFFTHLVKEYIDILFANEEEAKAFTGQAPGEALDIISEWVDIAVVKTGSQGSLIKHKGETHRIGIIPARPIDTTGAGDLYASGFLYGLAAGKPLQRCGELGALLAGHVIECMGSKMDEARWISILQQI